MRTQNISASILRRMRASQGAVFSPKDFLDLGSRAAVDQALTRAVRDGKVRRVARGLYDVPRKSPLVGQPAASLDAVASTIARKSAARLASTGAQAANFFGLSTQVPAQARYLTDRSPRTIEIGNRRLHLQRVVPRRLVGNPMSQAVLEALRYLGQSGVSADDIQKIRRVLSPADRRALKRNVRHAPDWMRPHLDALLEGPKNDSTDPAPDTDL